MNAQQLRNSILQEAIEGRLVPQDPNDEPASVLLDRIRKEKEILVKEGKLKKKDLEVKPISEDEIPFDIPESWEWCRVCDISESFIGLTYKPSDVSESGWIVLRSSNIQNGQLDYNDIVKVNIDVPEKLHVKQNDIIICARNGSKKLVGKSAIVRNIDVPTTFGAFMAICRTSFYEYMAKYLLSPLFFTQLRKESDTTTINQLTQNNFNKYLVPLPPLAEQHRIVAKIEELLPKVEEYGKAQEALNKLNEELPEKLKKSVLQEAITGKLVPQDPNDEPASVLLNRIREEKKRLVKEGKLKKKDLEEAPINEDEIPFDIPDSWEWCRFSTYLDVRDGTHDSPKYYLEGVPFVTSKNLSEGKIDFSTCKFISNEDHIKFSARSYVEDGDILFAMIGSIGNPVIVRKDCEFSIKNVALFKRYASYLVNENYIFYYLSFIQYEFKQIASGGVQSFLGLSFFRNWMFPLPPLAEQKRIVAKIEEVFKEIDKLKV